MKDQCKNQAAMKRCWPGKDPDMVCIEHAEDSKRIADAMGFHIDFEPIGYSVSDPIPDEFPTCCCSAGFSQKVSIK